MKLKQRPEDFVVREICDHPAGEEGSFAIFRLSKTDMDTMTAVRIAAAKLRVRPAAVRYAGLKDAHAKSEQIISVPIGRQWRDGVPRLVRDERFTLEYLGRSDAAVTPRSLVGNEFEITIRDLVPSDLSAMPARAEGIEKFGVPNYYDSQRFGQLRSGAGFIGKMLIRGDHEGALKAAIAAPARKDRRRIKTVRRTIAGHWGRWEECLKRLPRSTERSVVTYLASHPTDFAAAFELLPRDLRLLYVSAYQSFLWNRVACAILTERCTPRDVIRFDHESGPLVFYDRPDEAVWNGLSDLSIPLLCPNTTLEPPLDEMYGVILADEGLSQGDLRLKGLESTYFPRGSRRLIVVPRQFSVGEPKPDELNRGRRAVVVRCTLPPGAYATMLVKRLTLAG